MYMRLRNINKERGHTPDGREYIKVWQVSVHKEYYGGGASQTPFPNQFNLTFDQQE